MAKCNFCDDSQDNAKTRMVGGFQILDTCKVCPEEIVKEFFITKCDHCEQKLNQMKGEDIYIEKLNLILCDDCYLKGQFE